MCRYDTQWITATLRTIGHDHKNLQRVSIMVPDVLYHSNIHRTNPADFIRTLGETVYQEWLELDKLLAQLQESHSIRPEIQYDIPSWVDRKQARFHGQSVTGAHDERVGSNGGAVTACWVRAGGAEIFAGEWRMETSLWFEHSPGGWVTNNARITIDSECGHGRIVVAVDSIFTHLIHKDDILY